MPEPVKDTVTIFFGLLIAYVIPGMIGLYDLTFWFSGIRRTFINFEGTLSNAALFVLIFMAALAVGLILNSLRWAIFESWRSDRLRPEEMARLGINPAALAAYCGRVDDDFRFHQFNGATAIALPLFFLGWLKNSWVSLRPSQIVESVVMVIVLEAVVVLAALDGYSKFVQASRRILKG